MDATSQDLTRKEGRTNVVPFEFLILQSGHVIWIHILLFLWTLYVDYIGIVCPARPGPRRVFKGGVVEGIELILNKGLQQ